VSRRRTTKTGANGVLESSPFCACSDRISENSALRAFLLRDKEERLLPSYRLSQLGRSDDPNFLVFERPRYYTSSGNAAQDVPRSGDESLPQSGTAHAEMQMPKNIVICCDANYEGNKGGSNVLKLYLPRSTKTCGRPTRLALEPVLVSP